MARILIMPLAAGYGLAHAGACHAIAVGLANRGHDVTFGYGGDLGRLFDVARIRTIPVQEIPRDRLASLNLWFEDRDDFEAMVQSDREVIEREQADIVISDSRPSTPIAAHDAGVPDIGLCHFLSFTPWSLAARLPGPRWARRARHPILAAGRWWEARGRDMTVGHRLGEVIDRVRAAHGLPGQVHALAGGQFVACSSTPLLDPASWLPENWRHIGHISFSTSDGHSAMPELNGRPVVYVTQGSSGEPAALFRAVRDLARLPVHVLVTTAHLCDPSDLEDLAPNVTAARYLPGRACLERASVAVVHGGHMTSSDAHLTGTPLVVVPFHSDHHIWAARVQRLGTGIPVEGPLLPGRIRRAVSRLLDRDEYQRRMKNVAAELSTWDPAANVDQIVHELLAR